MRLRNFFSLFFSNNAGRAKERAKEKLAQGGLSDKEYKIVEAKLQRALVRLSVKS